VWPKTKEYVTLRELIRLNRTPFIARLSDTDYRVYGFLPNGKTVITAREQKHNSIVELQQPDEYKWILVTTF